MFNFNMSKKLEPRALLVFFRLQRFFQTFNVVAALIAGLSLAVLSFAEFHPTTSSLTRASEGFLCSSALTSVVAVMLATMLLFRFEGVQTASRKDLAIAWAPLVLLDWGIVEFLVGLVFWYAEKNNEWRSSIMGTQFAVLLLFTIWTSIWMWGVMSQKGGLGKEEDDGLKGLKQHRIRQLEERSDESLPS
ncbi:hypothetical protein MMC22_006868 [Lobaria immixta]|nr:hypothetical protein [Lobaria immixta]